MFIEVSSVMLLRVFTVCILLCSFSQTAYAECAEPNKVSISAALPSYSFWTPVTSAMGECGNITVNIVNDLSAVGISKLQGQERPENILAVSTSNFDVLKQRNALKPLDDLVTQYGGILHERQLIRENGKVVAIAIAANTQSFLIHEELFKQQQLDVPQTYDELVAVSKKLEKIEAIKNPLALAMKDGWNIANQFVNFHLANDGILLDSGKLPLVNTNKGIASLVRLKELTPFLPEKFNDAGPANVQQYLLKGEVGMAILWASSLAAIDSPAISRVSGRMKILPMPAMQTLGKPASTLWWDGFGISISSSNEEAEAAFKVMMEGLDDEMLAKHNDAAVWLMKSYKPGRLTKAVIDAIEKDIPHYPASEEMQMLHTALGEEIPKFLKGEKSPGQALADAESAYLAAAKERGLIN